MACYRPLAATQLPDGRILIRAKTPGRELKPSTKGRDFQLPCGGCIGCREKRKTDWATRCLHESQMHRANCALTLTYSDDANYSAVTHEDRDYPHQDMWIARKSAREFSTSAPKGLEGPNIARVDNSRSRQRRVESLSLIDHQKFIRALRKKLASPIRYYMCGEYGEKLSRPHYHYLIFGYDFPDKKYFKTSRAGTRLYRSPLLEQVWTYGHAWVGEVDYATCAYVAGYVMKKMTGEKAWEHYRRVDEAGNDYWLLPEFNLMSRRPGIGKTWWDTYQDDVLVDDLVKRGTMESQPPRYYDELLKRENPLRWSAMKKARQDDAQTKLADATPARLEAREGVHKARVALKKRLLESN